MADKYARLETWEVLKNHVFSLAPSLEPRVAAFRDDAWRRVTVLDAQTLALLIFQNADPWNPTSRRRARGRVKALLEELAIEESGNLRVREPDADLDILTNDARRAEFQRALKWIEKEPPAEFLDTTSGPKAAISWARKAGPALGGLRANRWLSALGYPMATPDLARQRLLQRLGWLEEKGNTAKARTEAVAAMEELARAVEAPLGEVDLILGVFSGAVGEGREAARCLTQPLCKNCPISAKCRFFKMTDHQAKNRTRTLTSSMRSDQRPRERLKREGAAALSEEELIAILLRTGNDRDHALDVAQQLLRAAGALERLPLLSIQEMSKIRGVGEVKAITIKAALELARRLKDVGVDEKRVRVTQAKDIYTYLRPRFVGATKEEFLVILLNTKLEIIRTVMVSKGTINQSLVHPREVFSEAVRESAYAVILAHNHPSGDATPSKEDQAVTYRLVKAGDIMGMKVLDHIIVGAGDYFSFADEGRLNPP